jgi:hypothetical protein
MDLRNASRQEQAMTPTALEIEGTLQPDGTLLLDQKPALPPGRVRVTVRSVAPSPQAEPFWATLRAIWDDQQRRGHVPRSVEEIQADRQALREGMDEEIEETIRLQDESRRLREEAESVEQDGK